MLGYIRTFHTSQTGLRCQAKFVKTKHCSFHQKHIENFKNVRKKCTISSDLCFNSNICSLNLQFYLKWRY